MNLTPGSLLTTGLLILAWPGYAQNSPTPEASPPAAVSQTPESSATPAVSPTTSVSPRAAVSSSPAANPLPVVFEPLPTLDASVILQPQYLIGPHFTVRNAVPTYSGSNHYIIDSDFGVFDADGNEMLMRRVAEINAIAELQAMSQTKEFTQAAAQAAQAPLQAAQDLVTNPVSTISSVPKGIWGFFNRAKATVTEAVAGNDNGGSPGNAMANLTGFSRTKRDLSLKLGVDPYSTNQVFQSKLNQVAWPAFLGKITVDVAMAAVGGPALSAVNLTGRLTTALRDKNPAELRQMNRDLLMNNMGVSAETADAFLYNSAISPTTQTLLVAALGQLGNIPGQAEFIRQAASSQDEHDGLAFQQSAQLMANLNNSQPVVRIMQLEGLTVCLTKDGMLVIPIQWDYVVWTPGAKRFLTALKAENFGEPVSSYSLIVTGAISPLADQELSVDGISVTTKALPGPLR
ncbi:MAG: hypothetical protein JO025_20295 [Verrucomicrobia bacterium]|nr:hypothetical protein [Verrucomicrobiota bacterium]